MDQVLRKKIYYFDYLIGIQLLTVFVRDYIKIKTESILNHAFTFENLVSLLIFIFLYKVKSSKEGTKQYSLLTIVI